MTEGGFSGNERYLALPVALGCVLAGAGCAWAARGLGDARSARLPGRRALDRPGRGRGARWPPRSRSRSRGSPSSTATTASCSSRPSCATSSASRSTATAAASARWPAAPRTPGAYNVAMVSWFLDVPGREVAYQTWLPGSGPGVAFRARVAPQRQPDAAGEPQGQARRRARLESRSDQRGMDDLRGLWPMTFRPDQSLPLDASMAAVAARLRALPFLSARSTTLAATAIGLGLLATRVAVPAHPVHRRRVLDRRGAVGRHRPARAARHPRDPASQDGSPPLYYMTLHVWMTPSGRQRSQPSRCRWSPPCCRSLPPTGPPAGSGACAPPGSPRSWPRSTRT